MLRMPAMLVALLLPLAAALPATATAAVEANEARACAGLHGDISLTIVDNLTADWLATHEETLRPGLWRARVRSTSQQAQRRTRDLDRRAASFVGLFGPRALTACVRHREHAPSAARSFARHACMSERTFAPAAAALLGELWTEDFGTAGWLGRCTSKRARSPELAGLARAQVAAATGCGTHQTATAGWFGLCVMHVLRPPAHVS